MNDWNRLDFDRRECLEPAQLINNGNRTKWIPIWSVIVRLINKIGRREVLLQINHNRYNFRTKKEHLHLGQISPVETMSQAKNSSTLEIPLFLQDFAVVVAVVIVINSIIGGFR